MTLQDDDDDDDDDDDTRNEIVPLSFDIYQ
jgi:hypothetical protein